MDLPEVVSVLSLVFEVQGITSGDGHDHPEGGYLWRNHPKILGPGALIFVAKQL